MRGNRRTDTRPALAVRRRSCARWGCAIGFILHPYQTSDDYEPTSCSLDLGSRCLSTVAIGTDAPLAAGLLERTPNPGPPRSQVTRSATTVRRGCSLTRAGPYCGSGSTTHPVVWRGDSLQPSRRHTNDAARDRNDCFLAATGQFQGQHHQVKPASSAREGERGRRWGAGICGAQSC